MDPMERIEPYYGVGSNVTVIKRVRRGAMVMDEVMTGRLEVFGS